VDGQSAKGSYGSYFREGRGRSTIAISLPKRSRKGERIVSDDPGGNVPSAAERRAYWEKSGGFRGLRKGMTRRDGIPAPRAKAEREEEKRDEEGGAVPLPGGQGGRYGSTALGRIVCPLGGEGKGTFSIMVSISLLPSESGGGGSNMKQPLFLFGKRKILQSEFVSSRTKGGEGRGELQVFLKKKEADTRKACEGELALVIPRGDY